MLCPLQGKKLSRLTFLFLRDAQSLGPSEVKATEGQSTSRHCSAPAPCCFTPGAAFCKGPTFSHSQDPGPSCHCNPTSSNMPGRCPLLATGILKTAWSEVPLGVHGCPLVAARGIEPQAFQTPALWEGASQFRIVLQARTFRSWLTRNPVISHRARGRSQLGELIVGSIGQGPWKTLMSLRHTE